MADEKRTKSNLSRRSFALGLGGAAALFGLGGAVKALGSESLSRPPGGEDEDHFLASCVRCEKCREVCPRGVIRPAKLETGLLNTRTPTMRFTDNWCDFCEEAHQGSPLCVEVCPTQALTLAPGATKETTIIGKAYIRHDWCLGWLLKDCQICFDACPYEAIELDEFLRPHVIWDTCNGCGKCETVCVSMKATSLVAGATHRAVTIQSAQTATRLLNDGAEAWAGSRASRTEGAA